MEEKIRPMYSQLMGILSQTPFFDSTSSTISAAEIWEEYNSIVDRLIAVSGKDYSEFKIIPKSQKLYETVRPIVSGTFYRQKLNSLINYLHAEYFKSERAPFSGEAQQVFQANQTVSQTTDVNVLMVTVLEIQEKLIKKENDFAEDTPEKNFIVSLKEKLQTAKSTIDLVNLIAQTAIATGLSLPTLLNIFS